MLYTASGVLGEAPATNDVVHIGSQKVQLSWQKFLSIFLRTNVIFCTKRAWYRTAGPILLIRRRPMRSFSPGAVATIAVCKSGRDYV